MAEYEDQYAAAIELHDPLQGAPGGFDQDAHGEPRARSSARAWSKRVRGRPQRQPPMMILAVHLLGARRSKPANARLVAAAIRDTREVWASHFLPGDRARVIAVLADLAKRVPDETARTDLAAFMAALQAVN